MICTFFGHRDASSQVEPILETAIEKLIIHRDVKTFYVGDNGNFDNMTRKVLKNLKRKYPHIFYAVILSRLPISSNGEDTSDTIFPEGLENSTPRFAIVKRNEWLVKKCDIVVAYVRAPGGAQNFVDLAIKKGKEIINLAEHV